MATMQDFAAKDAWLGRVLNFVPPARNREPIRLELRAGREQVGTALSKAVLLAPDYEGNGLAKRADTLLSDMDRSLAETDVVDDTVPVASFAAAVASSNTILAEMVALTAKADALAKVAATRSEERKQIIDEFTARSEGQGKQQEIALKVFSPGKVDTDLRDAQNEVQKILGSSDFASNTASDGAFTKAVALAKAQLTNLKPAETSNAARATKAPVVEVIDGLRKTQQALAGHGAFGELAKAMEPQLASQRSDLLAGADADAAASVAAATNAAKTADGKLQVIKQAADRHDELLPKIDAAVKAADASPAKELKTQWVNALAQAKTACATGANGAAAMDGVAKTLDDVVALSKNAGDLRTRAEALVKDYGAVQTGLSADQKAKIGDVEKLKGSLADITMATYAGLEKQVGDSETALKDAKLAAETFKTTKERLAGSAASIPNALQAKVDGPTMFNAALLKAESERVKNHAQGKRLLDGLDAGVEQFKMICVALAGFDGMLAANPEVAKSMAAGLGGIQKEIATALGSGGKLNNVASKVQNLGAVIAAWQAYHKLYPTLDLKATEPTGAAKDAVRGSTPLRDVRLKAAQTSAEQGDAGGVTTQLESLKEWLEGIRAFISDGPKVLKDVEARRVKLGPEIGALLKAAIDNSRSAALKKDFGLAGTQALALGALIGPAEALNKAHVAAKAELAKVTGTGVKDDAAGNQKEDESLAKRLADELLGLKPQANDLDARKGRLDTLLQDMRSIIATRRQRIQDEVGGSALGPDKAAAAFADDETGRLATQFYAEFGKEGFVKLLTQIGDGSGGPKAVTKFIKQLAAMGGSDLTMLAKQLGDIGNIGKLSSADGTAFLPQDLAIQFRDKPDALGGMMKQGVGGDVELFKSVTGGEADRARSIADKMKPADLRTLLKDGFGDDHATIQAIIKSGDNEASQLKTLSDAFPDRTELARLTANLGGPDAGPTMKLLAQTNFGGKWEKLKDPFFKELSVAPGGDRLMKNAKQFKGNKPSSPAVSKHGFAGVAIEHVHERHIPDSFNFGDIKPDNTQFAEKLRDKVADICGDAIAEVRALLDWNALPAGPANPPAPAGAVEIPPLGVAFRKFTVSLPPPYALSLQVGIDTATNTVDQIFPLSGDNYSEAQMTALKKALNK